MHLGLEEGRVIGCLVEKQLTTPQQYPLTLNAVASACNQSSNRDPVVSYDEGTVERSLASLRDAGLVRVLHPSHGRSVKRYSHTLGERLGLDDRRLSVVAVLLLRGPQTTGELRARTERMAGFEGSAAVEAELRYLSDRPEPLVLRLPRRPGQKEERWVQLLTGGPDEAAGTPAGGPGGSPLATEEPASGSPLATEEPASGSPLATEEPASGSPLATEERLNALAGEVALLRAEVTELRALLRSSGDEGGDEPDRSA